MNIDNVAWHIESIQEKNLPVDEITAYNHMDIYLRWCMENDLMSVEFTERYWEQVQPFMVDLSCADLRSFIRDYLSGKLFLSLFNDQGEKFSWYYYGGNDAPYYPSDIDDYALQYFGPERYHSHEFQDEAYLFIPFDEEYYQAMSKIIEKRFINWQKQNFDVDTWKPSDVAQAIMKYLDCECTHFPSMKNDDPIISAYSYAKRDSAHKGFVPVLIKADDENLWECLILNSDPDSDGKDGYAFDSDKVAEYRKKMLATPIKDGKVVLDELIEQRKKEAENGKAVLEELLGRRKEEAEDDNMDWEEEILGEMEGGYDNCRFSSYWDPHTSMTYPLILAKIPVKNPWEIFAYLPFGNWNGCPDTPQLMAAAKYWAQQYGAVPAVMTNDELEFTLTVPIPEEKAMEVAREQYGFCPDLHANASISTLANTLRQSTVWYFWWD